MKSAPGGAAAWGGSPVASAILVLGLAIFGGVAWGMGFGARSFVVAPWVTLAPAFLLLAHRRGVWLVYLHGVVTWLTALYWIAPTLATYGPLHPALAAGGLLVLALYLGLYQLLFAVLAAPVWRRGGALALFGTAAIWLVSEWVRGHLLSGFSWNLAAHSWLAVPGALDLAPWIGAWGVTFLVALANAGVASFPRSKRLAAAGLGLPVVLLAAAVALPTPGDGEEGPARPVRVIQPNIPNQVGWDPELALANHRRLFELSHRACDEEGALLVWPESAGWPYRYGLDGAFSHEVRRLVAAGCPLILNSPTQTESGEWRNSGLRIDRDGGVTRYDKRHLVPFGEYVPPVFSFVGRLARNAGDFSPAEELTLLPWEEERLGMAICYEVIFPTEVAETVRAGASMLVTVTNDAWYGDTSAPWQHFAAARFRAAETRRPLLRAAITGVSAVVAPDGSVVAQLGVGGGGSPPCRGCRADRSDPLRRAAVVGAAGRGAVGGRCDSLFPEAGSGRQPRTTFPDARSIMIPEDAQQRIEQLSLQLQDLRGFL